MTDYLDVPIETDPDTLADGAFSYIQTFFPGWVPNAGNLETILVEAMAQMVAEARTVASAVPTSIYRYFGGNIVGLLPLEDAPAYAQSTWTAINNSGYTIEAGTFVGLRSAGDVLVPFEVLSDVVIPPGSTATAAGAVTLKAVEPGIDGNALPGPGELIDSVSWVASVVLTAPSSGGVTAEEDSVYLGRLTEQLQLLAPRPIIPSDFASLAKNIAGVSRAVAIDGYNPSNSTFNNERMVAIAAIDSAGNAVSPGVKSQIDAYLQSEREVNFIVSVFDPTYTTIDITTTFKAVPGYAPATVAADVSAALAKFLSPALWGTSADVGAWLNSTIVRYLEIATTINNVLGVDYITALTFRVSGGSMATTDITLTGAAPLPRPGVISVTGS